MDMRADRADEISDFCVFGILRRKSEAVCSRSETSMDMRADRADEIRRFSSKITSDSEQTPCSLLPSCEYLLSS